MRINNILSYPILTTSSGVFLLKLVRQPKGLVKLSHLSKDSLNGSLPVLNFSWTRNWECLVCPCTDIWGSQRLQKWSDLGEYLAWLISENFANLLLFDLSKLFCFVCKVYNWALKWFESYWSWAQCVSHVRL